MSPLSTPTLHPPHLGHHRTSSTSSLRSVTSASGSQQQQDKKKKVVTACQRCRTRKIKCDGALPSCGNCAKANVECIEVDRFGNSNVPRSHVLQLENRIKWLEEIVAMRCPDIDLSSGPQVSLRSDDMDVGADADMLDMAMGDSNSSGSRLSSGVDFSAGMSGASHGNQNPGISPFGSSPNSFFPPTSNQPSTPSVTVNPSMEILRRFISLPADPTMQVCSFCGNVCANGSARIMWDGGDTWTPGATGMSTCCEECYRRLARG